MDKRAARAIERSFDNIIEDLTRDFSHLPSEQVRELAEHLRNVCNNITSKFIEDKAK